MSCLSREVLTDALTAQADERPDPVAGLSRLRAARVSMWLAQGREALRAAVERAEHREATTEETSPQ